MSVADTVTRLGPGQQWGQCWIVHNPQTYSGTTSTLFGEYQRSFLGCVAVHSSQSLAYVKNAWSVASVTSYAIMIAAGTRLCLGLCVLLDLQ